MLDHLPKRENKPRQSGVTMVMDKGLGVRQAQDLVETSGHLIDFLKLGFGTSYVSRKVKEKIKIYQDAGIKVYVGGTLLEAFLVRNQFDDYLKYIAALGCDTVEVSDGCFQLASEEKCRIISRLANHYTVLSEVGAKEETVHDPDPGLWISSMKAELDAGSSFVIGEARESGTVGIYEKNGSADMALINAILDNVPAGKIMWEAPLKQQQVWFIRLLGPSVNLGNIAPAEIAPLETLRLGLRGDTFFESLPEELKKRKQ